jgi:SAM-dependent methyltransferase
MDSSENHRIMPLMVQHRSNISDVYQNAGNLALVQLIPHTAITVLDIGCGAGDNAKLLRSNNPKLSITGITLSRREAELARLVMQEVFVADLEIGDYTFLRDRTFDLILCSHVLEHLKNPGATLKRLADYVDHNGHVLIALPNIAEWRNRIHLAAGGFDYTDGGIMDASHLRFFNWKTAEQLVRSSLPDFEILEKRADGRVPLWKLRGFMPEKVVSTIDRAGLGLIPNLLAWQVVILAKKL